MTHFQNRISGKAILGLGLLAGIAAAPALATAASLEMGLQVRYRGEADMRDFNDDTDAEWINSQRTRLNAKVDHERYHAFLQIQDVRNFGSESSTADFSAEGLDMHQAFMKVDDVFGSGVGVQVGRQEINFADERLVGAVDWTQQARSFDGFVLSRAFGDQGVVVPFLLQLNESDTPFVQNGNDGDAWVTGFHSIWNVAEGHTFQPHVYFAHDGGSAIVGIPGVGDLNLYTLGFYYTGSADNISFDFTADYQTGDLGDIDISAYLVAANVAVQSGQLMVGGGVDYLSGDEKADNDYEAFNTLFATNHKFYGYMDYFTNFGVAGNDTANLGLIDYHVKGWYTIDGPTKAGIDVHYFMTAEEDETRLADDKGDAVDTLGTEVDFGFKTKSGPVDIYAGYSVFFQDDAMEALRGPANPKQNEDISHWAFVMASIAFP